MVERTDAVEISADKPTALLVTDRRGYKNGSV